MKEIEKKDGWIEIVHEEGEVSVDLVGMSTQGYPHPDMKNWRLFRIEYGGCNEDCYAEGHIWLPPWLDPDKIEELMYEKIERIKND
jgi:hypothetical protein